MSTPEPELGESTAHPAAPVTEETDARAPADVSGDGAPSEPGLEAASVSDGAPAATSELGAGTTSGPVPPDAVDPAPEGDALVPEGTEPVSGGDVGPPPSPVDSSTAPTDASSSWAAIARGVALWVLLGFALVAWARFSWGRAWFGAFLKSNQLEMSERVTLIVQIFAGGALAALAAGAVLFVKRRRPGAIVEFERWAWLCSPLILVPAIPVMRQTDVWVDNHDSLLPLVLFGALLVEFFFAQALSRPPARVLAFFRSLRDELDTQQGRVARWVRQHGYLTVIVVAAVAYAAFMSFYTIRWHHKLGTAIFDLGINNNLFAGGLHGKINHSPVIFPEDPAKYWANHVKLGLYLFLPIYALVPRAETLLVIQSVSLGLGAIPLFLFGRRYVPQWIACVIALAYLSYYPLHGANFYEMKEPPTAAAFVLTMIWALEVERYKTAWVFFFCALIMREDMPICLAVTGLFLLWSGHRPRLGAVMAAISTAWFIFIRFKVMTDAGSWWFPSMYKDLYSVPDTGFRSVLKTLISNPAFVLEHIFVEKKFWYLMHLLVPVVFLPARRWYLWAAFVPGAILTLLITDYDPPLMFSFQYVMYWAPYLFVTAILAVRALSQEHPLGWAKASGAVLALAFSTAALSYNYGAFPRREGSFKSGYRHVQFEWTEADQKTYDRVVRLVESIPPDASVAASEKIGAHLSGREHFYTLRRGTHGAEYLVTRKGELRLDRTRDSVRDALEGRAYGLERRFGDFVVLRKGADPKHNDELLLEWELVKKPKKPRGKQAREAQPPEQDNGRGEEADAHEGDTP